MFFLLSIFSSLRPTESFLSDSARLILLSLGLIVVFDIYAYVFWKNATISDIISSYFVFNAHPLMSAFFGAIVGGLMVHFLGFVPVKDPLKEDDNWFLILLFIDFYQTYYITGVVICLM